MASFTRPTAHARIAGKHWCAQTAHLMPNIIERMTGNERIAQTGSLLALHTRKRKSVRVGQTRRKPDTLLPTPFAGRRM